MTDTNHVPPILYKYRSISEPDWKYTQRIFTHSEMFMASRTSFNDPFDCRAAFALAGTKQEYRDQALKVLRDLPRAERRAKAKQIVRTRKVRHAEDEKTMKNLLDVEMDTKMSLLCLTERPDHILMWSHYADSHAGICVGFDCTADSPFRTAKPVTYQTEYPVVRALSRNKRAIEIASVFTKASEWKYEREWRLADFVNGPIAKSVDPKYITQIILGARIADDRRREIEMLASQHVPHAAVFKAKLKANEYGIELELLTPG